jgi:hypothetical protein
MGCPQGAKPQFANVTVVPGAIVNKQLSFGKFILPRLNPAVQFQPAWYVIVETWSVSYRRREGFAA